MADQVVPIQAVREGQEAETECWATVVDEAIRLYFREHPGEPFHAGDTSPTDPQPAEEERLFDLCEAAQRPLNPLVDREAA